MGRPKGSKNKPKTAEIVEEVTTKPEETPQIKERKPRATKATKKSESSGPVYVDSEEVLEIRRKLDDNTLDPYETITTEKLECEFVGLTQWMSIIPESDKEIRSGRYSGCFFPVKGCNHTVWPIVAYIKTDLDKHRTAGYNDKTIYAACINYLSSQTAGKKKKYGNLMPFTFSIKDDKIVATFMTDVRKNAHFWSEGVMV